jgi:uncharacterized membrane protein (UPF0127 family)
MRKNSESLLTLESPRNENFEVATQKDPGSEMRYDSRSPFSPAESYEQGHISDVSDGDSEVALSLSKNSFQKTLEKISSSVGKYGTVITYNIDPGEHVSDSVIKLSSKGGDDFLRIDLRNSPVMKKFSGFLINLEDFTPEDQKRIFSNISQYSRPVCKGVIVNANKKSVDYLSKLGFEIKESDHNEGLYYVEKNEISKVASIEVADSKSLDGKAWFVCDIASNIEDKIAGLQIYPRLKYGSGLIFPYDTPQDVMYHMGTVDFPIDIIFIDADKKIKKICKNISPGTIGSFGAANISCVLEILGETSDKLGINVGDKITISSMSGDQFEKYASTKDLTSDRLAYHRITKFSNKKIEFKNYDIISGTSPLSIPPLSKIASGSVVNSNVSIFDFDQIIFEKDTKIKIFKKSSASKSTEASKTIGLKEFLSKVGQYKDYSVIPNKLGSFSNFMAKESNTNPEARRIIYELNKSIASGDKVVFATRNIENSDLLKRLILKRAEEELLVHPDLWASEIFVISSDLEPNQIIRVASEKFGGKNFRYISSEEFKKVSGIPIPDSIKSEAKKAYLKLKKSLDLISIVLDKLQSNNQEFSKIKDKPELIKTYKGAYQQSCRRNAKRVFDALSVIKSSLQIMNEIKDISSVSEKIDSLTVSCSQYVDVVEDIFALVEKISEPEIFIAELSENTEKFSKSTEDLENNINNFIDYISQNILNQKVLTK